MICQNPVTYVKFVAFRIMHTGYVKMTIICSLFVPDNLHKIIEVHWCLCCHVTHRVNRVG